jgi:hypothetical protein
LVLYYNWFGVNDDAHILEKRPNSTTLSPLLSSSLSDSETDNAWRSTTSGGSPDDFLEQQRLRSVSEIVEILNKPGEKQSQKKEADNLFV